MLHEVAAGDLDPNNIVNPVRKLLRRVSFYEARALKIDLHNKTVTIEHGFDEHTHKLDYDQIVLALGSTTQFFDLPGVEEHALTMKTLTDAVKLRNHLIAVLEETDTRCTQDAGHDLLSVIVAGAGFAGVETLASINDFLRHSMQFYRNLSKHNLRLTLIHPGDVLLPELSPRLGSYAQRKLEERGVEVRAHSRVASYDGDMVQLTNGAKIPTRTLIWTAGTMPSTHWNPPMRKRTRPSQGIARTCCYWLAWRMGMGRLCFDSRLNDWQLLPSHSTTCVTSRQSGRS
jgi:NADH dehydrogenase